jgi:hypothetical protein
LVNKERRNAKRTKDRLNNIVATPFSVELSSLESIHDYETEGWIWVGVFFSIKSLQVFYASSVARVACPSEEERNQVRTSPTPIPSSSPTVLIPVPIGLPGLHLHFPAVNHGMCIFFNNVCDSFTNVPK